MILSTKTKGLLLTFTVISSLSVFSQAKNILPPQQKEIQKTQVSDAQLSKFANAYKKVSTINKEIQQKMVTKVEDSGLDVKRFNEINQAKQSQSPNSNTEISKEEEDLYNNVIVKINDIQQEFQTKVKKAITNEGIQTSDYEKIAAAIQTDPKLQQRLQQLLQS